MASGGYAIQRERNAAGRDYQPPRIPESNDDRNVGREHGGKGWCDARSRTRCHTLPVRSLCRFPNPQYSQSLGLRFSEDDTAIDYFGEQLKAAGYNYYGNEPMYSGITGQEFAADIYIGVVYYQRLRHMVLDKFQVRTTGPIDPLTRQPVKVRTFDC